MRYLFALALILTQAVLAQTGAHPAMHVTGPFEVKTTPQLPASQDRPGSFLIEKHYHGALEADATGQMLSGGDPKAGTAGYVAIETVTGTLCGHPGSFQLMHWGQMQPGKIVLKIEVVPGSGTGDLKGITGAMTITNDQGKHSYALDYTFPE